MRASVPLSVCSVIIGLAVGGCGTYSAPAAAPAPEPAPSAAPANQGGAPAELSIVGLVDGTTLATFSTTDLGLRDSRPVTGLQGDRRLVGIDYRVQDRTLYGVGDAGGVYTIDDKGAADKTTQLSIDLDGQDFGVDFNPAANALRIISDTGQNLRQPLAEPNTDTVADKALTNPATPPASGTVPAQGATSAGYTNNDDDKGTGTALFVLDTKADRVSIQSPANAGTFAPMGGLGVDAASAAGFDIYSPGKVGTVAALASLQVDGRFGLYRIDLLTGRAEPLGDLAQDVTDIAVPLEQG